MPPRTIREQAFGKVTVRLTELADGFAGVVVRPERTGPPIRGDDADELWRELVRELDKGGAEFVGFDGARNRFLQVFPSGFAGEVYRGHERDYKVTARDLLLETAPLERARTAGAPECDAAARVYGRTNLLSAFEQARTREVLKGSSGPSFLQAVAAVTDGDHLHGLRAAERIFRDYGQPSWPAVTYLPFLWRTDTQMFLKPQVTVDFAERVGHAFAREYSSRLEPGVYASLLDLAAETERELVPLAPQDRIDLQSFIWVVGAYDDADAEEVAKLLPGGAKGGDVPSR